MAEYWITINSQSLVVSVTAICVKFVQLGSLAKENTGYFILILIANINSQIRSHRTFIYIYKVTYKYKLYICMGYKMNTS